MVISLDWPEAQINFIFFPVLPRCIIQSMTWDRRSTLYFPVLFQGIAQALVTWGAAKRVSSYSAMIPQLYKWELI